MSRILLPALLLALSPVAAHSAVFTFDMVVVESVDSVPSPTFDLPDIGTMGTVSFVIEGADLDADPNLLLNDAGDPLPQALADATASFPAAQSLDATLTQTAIFATPGAARFSNGSFSSLQIDLQGASCPALACTLAGSFEIVTPGAAFPASFADVEALFTDPNATAVFRFNGTVQGEFVSFRAESVAPVPLPAGIVLLGSALGASTMLRRRRRAA